jgi:hypothetical protein
MSEELDPAKAYEELVRFIARSLLDTDDFEVSSSNKGGQLTIKLAAPEELRGRVIGKGGRIARSIRTLLEAAAFDTEHRPTLDIVD